MRNLAFHWCESPTNGDLSLMYSELIQSFLAGLAASGALTSTLRLITKAAFKNSKDGLRKAFIIQHDEDPKPSQHRLNNKELLLYAPSTCLGPHWGYVPLIEFIKITSWKALTAAVFSRFLLIPAFYFSANYGDQGWMILLTSFLGLSNGYLTVYVLTAMPK